MAMFTCGFGKRDITPPMGHPMAGYFKARFVKGVIDPLYVRATMFDDGQKKSMIISLDTVKLSYEIGSVIRTRVAQTLGMEIDAILINCSHTHTGPVIDNDNADSEYGLYLKDQAFEAAMEAAGDLAPARLFYAKTEAKNISFIRRHKMKDGTIMNYPSKFIEMIDHRIGTPNEGLYLLKIVRQNADDIYLFCFGTHADTIGGEYISADWPGFACSILEAAIPGSKAQFLLGPEGDVNHNDFLNPVNRGKAVPVWDEYAEKYKLAHPRHMGRVIAGQILTICDKAVEIDGTDISFGSQKVDLLVNKSEVDEEKLKEAKALLDAYDKWHADPCGTKCPVNVQEVLIARRTQFNTDIESFYVHAMKIGNFLIATLPGEPFTQLGNRIYEDAGYEKMMVLCNTNGTCGYIPTKDCFDDGGYESNSSRYKMGSDDLLVNGALTAIKNL